MPVRFSAFGLDDLLARVNDMGADLDTVVPEMLKETGERVTKDLKRGIAKHHQTGKTESALRERPEIIQQGNKTTCKVGFRLPEGLPARYINKGTPTNTPDPFVDRAINRRKVMKDYQKAFQRVIGE